MAIVIILAALVAVAAYKAYIPLESILGSIVEQRYISNALGGVYFGTQVLTHRNFVFHFNSDILLLLAFF